jgi:hypothetical protein
MNTSLVSGEFSNTDDFSVPEDMNLKPGNHLSVSDALNPCRV